jgi:hypothetical protein
VVSRWAERHPFLVVTVAGRISRRTGLRARRPTTGSPVSLLQREYACQRNAPNGRGPRAPGRGPSAPGARHARRQEPASFGDGALPFRGGRRRVGATVSPLRWRSASACSTAQGRSSTCQREEALRLLDEAQQEFAERKMWYDVALALLETAVLLLEEGRTAEVKELTPANREALAALRLFHEAAEREEATAAFASRVLSFLFRARHDEGLRFRR